jgi:hypothetical protein
MQVQSAYPTRLLVRCPTCRGHARVLAADYARAQMFCTRDGVPLIPIAVAAGAPRFGEFGTPDGPTVQVTTTRPPLVLVHDTSRELALA